MIGPGLCGMLEDAGGGGIGLMFVCVLLVGLYFVFRFQIL